jgi:predicted PolB exonuclease-like 3'-5' exonuclease
MIFSAKNKRKSYSSKTMSATPSCTSSNAIPLTNTHENRDEKKERKINKCPFRVHDIVATRPLADSRYWRFGKISNITPGGKYRIHYLGKIYPNREGKTGAYEANELVMPNTTGLLAKSVLAKWDPVYSDTLENKDSFWNKWNPSEKYYDDFFNDR